jgi:hypothetical protein
MLKNKMSESIHLKLYYKIFKLIKYLFGVVKNFPKEHKYSLGKEILNLSWSCIDLVIGINNLEKKNRYLKIKKLSIAFDCLKIRIRLTQEIKLISEKQFCHIQTYYMEEIGEMIGGWLKWSKTSSCNYNE